MVRLTLHDKNLPPGSGPPLPQAGRRSGIERRNARPRVLRKPSETKLPAASRRTAATASSLPANRAASIPCSSPAVSFALARRGAGPPRTEADPFRSRSERISSYAARPPWPAIPLGSQPDSRRAKSPVEAQNIRVVVFIFQECHGRKIKLIAETQVVPHTQRSPAENRARLVDCDDNPASISVTGMIRSALSASGSSRCRSGRSAEPADAFGQAAPRCTL